jgi:chorismate lyase/3-hydroxybenzoate synthase
MTSTILQHLDSDVAAPAIVPDEPNCPIWVNELVSGSHVRLMIDRITGIRLSVREATQNRFIRARVPNARALDDTAFVTAAAAAYSLIIEQLNDVPARHAVRFWNYIPDIHRPCSGGADRYMVFNTGRFEACRDWLACDGLPTASGVGHAGDDLIIDALSMDAPGTPVENPRQRPSYHYTRRFGPRPPCFARATLLSDRSHLLVGGTASVVGEDSMHIGNLAAQMDETLKNLASLVGAAAHSTGSLNAFTELRIYHPREIDATAISIAARAHFPNARIEQLTADLCRKELLVEIEGVAILPIHHENQ